MNKLKSKKFWDCAIERAIKTFCQSIVSLVGTNAILSFADWKEIVIVSATATILSILTSIASIKESEEEQWQTVD